MLVAPRVKICCISSLEEARHAVEHGAYALGLVSKMPSGPGVIPEALISEIATAVPAPIETFLLTSLLSADAIAEQHGRCKTSTVQLVDALQLEELSRLRRLLPDVALVQVVHVRGDESIAAARQVAPYVDALLLDSGNPTLAVKELGGTGRVHDWRVSRRIREAVDVPVFLAGGLNAGNVSEAIQAVRPFGLDLCSGVREDGRLSPRRLREFMQAIHTGATARVPH